jgi:ribosomal protein S18 acetylase RimI-like enzyme
MAAMALTVRTARISDIDDVLAFWRLAGEDTDRSDSRDDVRMLLARDPAALALAEDDGELVGSLIAGWDGWRCHLYRLAVHPDRRREGIGRVMISDAERRFAALGAKRVDAMVLDDNELGHVAWRATGYAPQPAWSRWVKYL